MTEKRFQLLLSLYCDGQLSPGEQLQLAREVALNPARRERFERCRRLHCATIQAVQRLANRDPQWVVRPVPATAVRPLRPILVYLYPVAAAACLALALGLLLTRPAQRPGLAKVASAPQPSGSPSMEADPGLTPDAELPPVALASTAAVQPSAGFVISSPAGWNTRASDGLVSSTEQTLVRFDSNEPEPVFWRTRFFNPNVFRSTLAPSGASPAGLPAAGRFQITVPEGQGFQYSTAGWNPGR